MPTGNFSSNTNNGVVSGEAQFEFNVTGPNDTAHVHAEAICRSNKWSFRLLEVTLASTGNTISLVAARRDGKGGKEGGQERK